MFLIAFTMNAKNILRKPRGDIVDYRRNDDRIMDDRIMTHAKTMEHIELMA